MIESSTHVQVHVGEASGHLLNWMIDSSRPENYHISPTHVWRKPFGEAEPFLIGNYCGDYAVGGPLFENAHVSSTTHGDGTWIACIFNAHADPVAGFHIGTTRLEAEARAYVVHLRGLSMLVPRSVIKHCADCESVVKGVPLCT